MELQLFTDLIDAIVKAADGIGFTINLPKTECDTIELDIYSALIKAKLVLRYRFVQTGSR